MNDPKNNRILSTLPSTEYQHLIKLLEPVDLTFNEILLEAAQKSELLYFPTQGIVSLVSVLDDGATTEIGLIGKEGMVGTLQFLGNGILNSRTMVQVKGTAMRIESEVLRVEFDRSEILQKLLLGYALKLFNQVSQGAACNNHHTVKQRTARWLLMLDDRSENKLSMTQQLLSQMLGVRRTGVSEIANDFKQQGMINYQRGLITILDRQALEAQACQCYQLVRV
ncbi:Crp/Fnr family transcriptional regulator [Pleurocapsa sp. PCC 7319]|uniref:Crp/Fnr family transcriptional regulator n=1 Tax=Pleurocapsa sp. PCC 7319 TaxID=118161 RepID=UPI00034A3DA8|nr:Crp/Fnr family transcriptional regulator [Pleurocapsa sp. PCC 7319]